MDEWVGSMLRGTCRGKTPAGAFCVGNADVAVNNMATIGKYKEQKKKINRKLIENFLKT